jgi:hypothetical protein
MDYALAFLRAILPESGTYAAWTKLAGKRSYNRFFPTIEQLAQHIAAEDAEGKTVYHACASFVEPGKRTQAKIWGARSLWLDIDAGKHGSPYATAVDAAEAVLRFAQQASLPRPTMVGSGGGIHCYWPLTESLGASDWVELATGLKAAAAAHQLHADPSRTTDLASVLRTPGTHNRKLETLRLVQCGPLEGPYDPDEFYHLLSFGGGTNAVTHSGVPVRAFDKTQPPAQLSQLAAALIVEPEYAPVHADDVADRCAQVSRLRSTRGNIPEPEWYAVLGVLAFCEDGYEKAHEWSSGYAGYTEAETSAKLDRALSLSGATTCAKLEGVHAAGCAACPLRGHISSPISAGAARGNVNVIPAVSATQQFPVLHSTPLSVLPPVPAPFDWRNGALVCVTEKGNESTDVLVSRHSIYLAGIGVGEVRGDRFAYHFRQWLPHRGWIECHVSAGKLFGAGGASELAERGAVVHDHKLFLNYVRLAADLYHHSEKLKMHYDQCGWKDDFSEFLIGDALYSKEGVQEGVTVSSELKTRAQWLGPQEGNLQSWSNAANALFAVGGEAQSFALACSFAAPLMRLQATDEGGAVVNLLSRGSGTGKTTTLAAVSTAWGMKQGLSLTNIDTRVSKAITLGVLGNLPVVYDELGNRDPQVIRDFITTFTNGRDKMRGAQDGTINHTQAAWQTIMVTASNISIHDLLAHTGGSDALAFRVLEFQCKLPEGVSPSTGDRLRIAMEKNAGWAGDAFIDYLMSPGVLPWAKQALEQWTADLWNTMGNRPEHRFWVRTLGAVMVAGKLLNQAQILEFQPVRIIDWALNQLAGLAVLNNSSLENRIESSVETLGEFLAEHVDCVLVVRRAHQQGVRAKEPPLVRPQRRALMRYEIEGRNLMISERALRDWLIKKEVGSRELLSDLEKIKLVKNKRRLATITAGTDIIGSQQAIVEIDASHPAVSGSLEAVKTIIQDNVQRIVA